MRSADSGNSWSVAHQLADVKAAHSDLAVVGPSHLLAVWSAPDQGGAAIFAARSRDGGVSWEPGSRISPPGTLAGYPKVLPLEGGAWVLWTERLKDDRVKLRSRKIER